MVKQIQRSWLGDLIFQGPIFLWAEEICMLQSLHMSFLALVRTGAQFPVFVSSKLLSYLWTTGQEREGTGAVERGFWAKRGGEGCSSLGSGRTSVKVEKFLGVLFLLFKGREVETGGRFSDSRLEVGGLSG